MACPLLWAAIKSTKRGQLLRRQKWEWFNDILSLFPFDVLRILFVNNTLFLSFYLMSASLALTHVFLSSSHRHLLLIHNSYHPFPSLFHSRLKMFLFAHSSHYTVNNSVYRRHQVSICMRATYRYSLGVCDIPNYSLFLACSGRKNCASGRGSLLSVLRKLQPCTACTIDRYWVD